MKQDVLFMGKELHVEGDNLSDILHYAFPQMVEAAIAVYNDLSFANNASKETTTFRQVAETWFKYYHVPNVSKATANNTRIHLDKHIYPVFGDKPLKDITRDDIQSFLVSNPNIGFTTIKSLKIVINTVLRKAMEDGLIDKNPASAKFPIPGKKGKRSSLSLENANDIIDHLSDLSFDDRFFIMVPLYAGLRRGEMLGLQWKDIDFDRKLLRIERSVTYLSNQPIVGTTKTEAGVRVVPLLPPLEAYLREYKDSHDSASFILNRNGVPLTQAMFFAAWERIKKSIDLHGATEHVFRHTFATMAEPYLDPKTLQSIMGHSDIQTTLNTYAHSRDDMIMAAGDNIADMYNK